MAAQKQIEVQSTDHRLLDVAVDQFGLNGIEGASTRAIAAAAGTMMSSITYHYGNKHGLYLAAAHHVANQMGKYIRFAPGSPDKPGSNDDADSASTAVLVLIDHFAETMMRPESSTWARFIVREQMEPTEAFDILYAGFMGQMVDRLSGLLVTIGQGRCSVAEARLKTLAILGQALVFRVARATVLRANDWTDIDAEGAAAIRRHIHIHTGAILTSVLSHI